MLEWIRTRSRRDLVLALFVAGAAALTLGYFAVEGFRFGGEGRHHDAGHQAHGGGVAFDRTFDVRAGGLLEIRMADADVAVSPASGAEARVVLRVDGHEVSAGEALQIMGFEVQSEGDRLSIRTQDDGDWSWRHDHDHDLDVSLEVTVPEGWNLAVRTGDGDVAVGAFMGDVSVQTGDGDVALRRAGGRSLRVQTGDGDIALARVASPEVQIHTGDGDVAAESVEADRIQIRTGDGDILLAGLSGALEATTGDGDVQVHLDRFAGLSVRTGDGDVTVYAPRGMAADVELSGGEFTIGEAFALPATLSERHLEGVLNGGGPRLSVRVGDGMIRLLER